MYLTKLLPFTIFCVGVYPFDTSYNPIVPIAFFLSNGYAPPPIDNPFLLGVTIFKKVLDELSDEIKERAFPVLTLDISYTLYANVLLQISYITAVSPITCELSSRFETDNLEDTYVLSETSIIIIPPFLYWILPSYVLIRLIETSLKKSRVELLLSTCATIPL